MTNENEINEVQEVEAAKNAIISMVEEERAKQAAAEAASKKPEIKVLVDDRFATKEDVAAEVEKLRQENADFKALLMKAKAQGKATIREKEGESDDEVRKLYKGILPGF